VLEVEETVCPGHLGLTEVELRQASLRRFTRVRMSKLTSSQRQMLMDLSSDAELHGGVDEKEELHGDGEGGGSIGMGDGWEADTSGGMGGATSSLAPLPEFLSGAVEAALQRLLPTLCIDAWSAMQVGTPAVIFLIAWVHWARVCIFTKEKNETIK
jgi:hypothetical protein